VKHYAQAGFIKVAVILLFLFGFFIGTAHSAAPDAVSWSPTGLSIELKPGQEETYISTLTTAKGVKHASIQVSSSLASYLSADLVDLDDVARAVSIDVNIHIAVPADASPGTQIDGSLMLTSGKRVLTDPLPITIKIISATGNQMPTANAGDDQSVPVNTQVQLDGGGSTDPDGDSLTYHWTLTGKPANSLADLSNPDVFNPTFVADKAGSYQAHLTVNDGLIDSFPDTVDVNTVNSKPVADAGPDQTVNEKTKVKLDGSLSFDPNGNITGYSWVQTGGIAVTLSDTAAAAPEFISPDVDQLTELVFNLTVTGNGGLSMQDQVVITVSDNQPPTVLHLIGVSSLSGDELTAEWLPGEDDKTPHANLTYILHVSESQGFTPSAASAKHTQNGIINATVNGLIPGTDYFAKVVAIDEGGLESWSNELSITTANVIAERSSAPVLVQGASQEPQVTEDTISFSNGLAPNVGEFIASAEGGGYLRKVIGVQTQNNQVIVATQPASLNEVFDTLEVNTNIKLVPLPEQINVAPLSQSSSNLKSPDTSKQKKRSWLASGLTLIDTDLKSTAVPSLSSTLSATSNVIVNNDLQTAQEKHLDFTGPAYWALNPGQTGTFTLKAEVARPKIDGQGNTVPTRICTIEFLGLDHKDPAKRGIIAEDQIAGRGLQIGTPVFQNFEATATLNVIWDVVDEKYVHDGGLPYIATFKAVLDELENNCAENSPGWPWDLMYSTKEEAEIQLPIYITMGNFPSQEKKTLTFSDGFTVTNNVTWSVKPEIAVSAQIQNAALQEATLAVNADIEFIQELTIQAEAAAALDQTLSLLEPRKFIKVFTVGGIPVVVSGEFGITARVQGNAKGAVNLTEALRYAFLQSRFGLRYQNGAWSEISDFEPTYRFSVDGNGDAGADLTITLVPDLQIHFYDSASGRMLVEPYLYTQAGIHGQFQYLDDNGGYLTNLDYWFTDLQAGGGLDLRLYAGFHIFDYNLLSYPNDVTVNDVDKFKYLKVIDKTPIAGIPELSAQVDFQALPPVEQNSCALLVSGDYQNVPNPFKSLFGVGPEAYIGFEKWNEPKIISTQSGASVVDAGDGPGRYWFHYTQPGDYDVRLSGYSNLGWFVNQVALPTPFNIALTDTDADGIVDQWETLWAVDDPDADEDQDGKTNSQEFQACTIPNEPATGKLNDTGITTCSDDTTLGLPCPIAGFPGQDGDYGRDVTLNDDSDGHAGFSFTKLDSNGNPLPVSATQWDCVKDNITGLSWEVKTDDGGLRDKDHTYTWYEPDNSKNGGSPGMQNGGGCTGSNCDTQGYVQAINTQGLCGASDWRMPNRNELLSIVNNATVNPAIDSNYFPNTPASFVWSSSPLAYGSNWAWYVYFYDGHVSSANRTYDVHVRLVRGGQ
jgi:hypothetical protein